VRFDQPVRVQVVGFAKVNAAAVRLPKSTAVATHSDSSFVRNYVVYRVWLCSNGSSDLGSVMYCWKDFVRLPRDSSFVAVASCIIVGWYNF
jgi:hypothetical protein